MNARAIIIACTLALLPPAAAARDLGQWEDSNWSAWFASLMQPDNPSIPCCGETDAYWADSFEIDGDRYVAIITDERDDVPLKRKPIPVGTRITIPNHKIRTTQSNPTGHGIVFVSPYNGSVYCYLPPGGV